MKPTPEQDDAVEKFLTGDSEKIAALAGSGKTTTLRLIADATPKSGCYAAFNTEIAKEAQKKFPERVTCATLHSFANQALRASGFPVDKLTGGINGAYVAKVLDLRKRAFGRADITKGDEPIVLSARAYGAAVVDTVRRFCHSSSERIEPWHIPWRGKLALVDKKDREYAATSIWPYAQALWERMNDPRSSVPLGHDGYLKRWALTRPTLPGDYVLLDEAQDSNDVTMALMLHQPAQLVIVGDQFQQLYEFRGAKNAMRLMEAKLEAC